MLEKIPAARGRSDTEIDSVFVWLTSLVPPTGLGASGQQVFQQMLGNPGKASYSTAVELAGLAKTSVSSVTRLAQRLGFGGWPDLQREVRVRHLAHLSVLEVADIHGVDDTPFQASVRQDLASLATSLQNLNEEQVVRIAGVLAAAENIYVTAQGSYAAVGHSLVHNIRIAGYPARELLDNDVSISNLIAQIGHKDVLIVCSYWRLYDVAVTAAAEAHARGATVIVIADNISPVLYKSADEVLLVPAEGSSFFPSLTAAMSVQQGIVSTLARLDPDRTRKSLIAVENSWQAFHLLHRSVPRITPDAQPGSTS